ncbi:hypothetical protein [Methylocystis bryophila]|uniref:hypothetical protein n=1 Tax=Methylocystis bryophila TaxID=655015 RepID=UPI00131A25AE|nr:hypothetical protein [Methylocystis bryophila]BDV37516.1 hypothetical protein DSM21852_07690 [Methylocystis bryophila]
MAPYPKYGYLLEGGAGLIGVILLIFSVRQGEEGSYTICNLSSWYVDPEYRGYASLLIAAAVRHKTVTYVNVSPALHTWRTIEAQGFRRYSDGMFVSLPALGGAAPRVSVETFDPRRDYKNILSAAEYELIAAHVDYGCVALIAMEAGLGHPFVFVRRQRLRGFVPNHQLCYCRDVADFPRFSGPLGRALIMRGVFLVLVDARAPLRGLPGLYFADCRPNYFKGPHEPAIGDLAFTEAVLFGL